MNPVEKAVFSLTRAILGNKKARTAFILYACALHLLVMYTTWECALSGSSQDQFQKQRNPFVRPLPIPTILCLFSYFRPVTIRPLLHMGIISGTGYYTLHNIIYTALDARCCDHVDPCPMSRPHHGVCGLGVPPRATRLRWKANALSTASSTGRIA